MKIVSWNCNGAFRKKYHLLDDFDADIYVIQECEDPARSNAKYLDWAGKFLWVGQSKNRGIGIFSRSGLKLEALAWADDGLQLFLPCRIGDSVNLVGVWTKHAKSPNFRYIGQFWKYLQMHKSEIAAHSTVICGDFNSNKQWDEWDRWWNHSDVVRELEEIEIRSLYHMATGEDQGNESSPTLFMHRKPDRPYHIDYAFASTTLIEPHRDIIDVGAPEKWLFHSDHMPVTFSISRK